MFVEHSTILEVDATKAWNEVQKPELLDYVAQPLIHFKFLSNRPELWVPGQYVVKMSLFGIVPLGRQTVGIELPPSEGGDYRVRDNGSGTLAKVWDHLIVIAALEPGRCRYTDRIKVVAGVLTPFVGIFAHVFYRHRQRRWRRLVANGFDYTK